MDPADPGFVTTIAWRSSKSQVRRSEDARAAFWRPIQQREQNSEIEGIEPFEQALLSNFPAALHELLREHFASGPRLQLSLTRGREWVGTAPRQIYAVFFRASIEGYGSALLGVDVGGVKELAELLGGNLDTFTMLMEAFVPAAFARSLPGQIPEREFEAIVAPTAALVQAFAEIRAARSAPVGPVPIAPIAPVTEPSKDSHRAKLPRALVATAFSLLTPVALALLVLFCAAQMLVHDREELTKRDATLATQEQDLRKAEVQAIADLRKENVELLRLLHPGLAAATPPTP
jgi:hypothetical protein